MVGGCRHRDDILYMQLIFSYTHHHHHLCKYISLPPSIILYYSSLSEKKSTDVAIPRGCRRGEHAASHAIDARNPPRASRDQGEPAVQAHGRDRGRLPGRRAGRSARAVSTNLGPWIFVFLNFWSVRPFSNLVRPTFQPWSG